MVVPVIHIYNDDIQINGNISEKAIQRECRLSDITPPLNPKLVSELKCLIHNDEDEYNNNTKDLYLKTITIRVEDKDLFNVKFIDNVSGK